MEFIVTEKDREYLRELAKRQKEIACLPIMRQREERWYAHNECRGSNKNDLPLIIMEIKYCIEDYLDLKCETAFAREIEQELLTHILNHELVDDDKVIPPYFTIYWKTNIRTFDLDMDEKRIKDSNGKSVGYTTIQHLKDLEKNYHKIGKTQRQVDKAGTMAYKAAVEEVLGDILPVHVKMQPMFNWYVSPSKKAEYLMGLESMMLAPYDCPEKFKEFYQLLVDDTLETFRWMQKEGILCLNNGNDYAGAGSYGFTNELPTEHCRVTGEIGLKDLWVNLNSQETVSVSPEMYGEYYWPYYKQLAEEFGLVYYGCCEPTNPIWKDYLSKLENLRKVSVSPWADDRLMGEYLKGTRTIFSKKPSPNFLAFQGNIDEEAYRKHIKESVLAARGCEMEIICRDVYNLYGDRKKLGRSVQLIRETVEQYW